MYNSDSTSDSHVEKESGENFMNQIGHIDFSF